MVKRWLPLSLALLGFIVFAFTRTGNYNGDGIGYARAVASRPPAELLWPGHLLYGIFNLGLYRLASGLSGSVSALAMMQWVNVFAGAVGVGLMGVLAARIVKSTSAAILATIGLAVSYGYWIQATDVETYALATTCVLGAAVALPTGTRRDTRPLTHTILAGALHGLAMLFHISMVLFYPAAVAGILLGYTTSRKRRAALSAYSVALLFIGIVPLVNAAIRHGGATSVVQVIEWLGQSGHGLPGVLEYTSAPRAIYGLANAFLYLGHLGYNIQLSAMEGISTPGDMLSLLRQYLLALSGLVLVGAYLVFVLIAGANRAFRDESLERSHLIFLILWMLPFAIIGIYYFPSDTERWVFLLPVVWLLTGMIAAAAPASNRIKETALLAAMVMILAVVNAIGAILPARDLARNSTYAAAKAINSRIRPADTVIIAGRDWTVDGYLKYFFEHENCLSLPSISTQGELNRDSLAKILRDQVAFAQISQTQVWLYGDFSTSEYSPGQWERITHIQLSRNEIDNVLSEFVVERDVEVASNEWLYSIRPIERPEY